MTEFYRIHNEQWWREREKKRHAGKSNLMVKAFHYFSREILCAFWSCDNHVAVGVRVQCSCRCPMSMSIAWDSLIINAFSMESNIRSRMTMTTSSSPDTILWHLFNLQKFHHQVHCIASQRITSSGRAKAKQFTMEKCTKMMTRQAANISNSNWNTHAHYSRNKKRDT